MDNKYYIELMDKFLRGSATEEEGLILKKWIETPSSKEICLAYFQNKWNIASNEMDSELQNKMQTDILNKIDEHQPELKPIRKIIYHTIIKYVAAACVVLIIGLCSYYVGKHAEYENSNSIISMSVDNGQKAKITLIDGTIVYINSGSTLMYNNTYNKKNRTVVLNGEAFFDVAKNKDKPFIVKTNNLDVEALGTSFNVRAYQTDKSIAVSLIEGKVKVTNNEKSEIIMDPNDHLKYNLKNKHFEKTTLHLNSSNMLWRSKELTFYGESFEEICSILNRMYGTQFIIKENTIKKYSFTGTIKNNSLENVLEFISLSAPIKYKIKSDNTVEIEFK